MGFGNIKDDTEPLGFKKTRIHSFIDKEIHTFELLLPCDRATVDYVKSLKIRVQEANEEHCAHLENTLSANRTAISIANKIFPSPTLVHKKNGELDVDDERSFLKQQVERDTHKLKQGYLAAYAWDQPHQLIAQAKLASFDREVKERNQTLYQRLKEKGHLRQVAGWQVGEDMLRDLEDLRNAQPHFSTVVDLVRDQIALARARKKMVRLPPILLLGEPGVGKTHFSQQLAAVLGAPVHRHSFDTATTEAALMGSDKRWSNSTFGLVFNKVCLGDFINPVILLDEIDKAIKGQHSDPLAPLHTLLEPVTSARAVDISIDFEFDASHIFWIASANDPGRIPASLRSRFIEFQIESPTGAHALQVAQAVADAVHRELDLREFERVSPTLVKRLAHLVPREQGQALRRAYASALANGRKAVQLHDLPAGVLADDSDAPDDSKGGTGYVH